MSDYYSKEDKIVLRNVLDKYNKYINYGISTYSNFLNSRELSIVTNYLNSKKIEYSIYPEYDFIEKKIIVFGNYQDYITYYKVNIDNTITHSNILGTLFSLGLNDDMIGDIIVEDGYFYLTSLSRMDEFLNHEFLSIKHKSIKLKKVEDIILEKEHFKSINILVSSYRLDNIVSKITNNSRSIIDRMILDKEITLNYHDIKNSSINLVKGDILSIRRHGKYKVGDNKGLTKKNKFILEVIKYV